MESEFFIETSFSLRLDIFFFASSPAPVQPKCSFVKVYAYVDIFHFTSWRIPWIINPSVCSHVPRTKIFVRDTWRGWNTKHSVTLPGIRIIFLGINAWLHSRESLHLMSAMIDFVDSPSQHEWFAWFHEKFLKNEIFCCHGWQYGNGWRDNWISEINLVVVGGRGWVSYLSLGSPLF